MLVVSEACFGKGGYNLCIIPCEGWQRYHDQFFTDGLIDFLQGSLNQWRQEWRNNKNAIFPGDYDPSYWRFFIYKPYQEMTEIHFKSNIVDNHVVLQRQDRVTVFDTAPEQIRKLTKENCYPARENLILDSSAP
jgi:hypothetical protein